MSVRRGESGTEGAKGGGTEGGCAGVSTGGRGSKGASEEGGHMSEGPEGERTGEGGERREMITDIRREIRIEERP